MSTKEALKDINQGIRSHHIWLLFGWFEIKMRYKRSLLGPFWLTASLAFMVAVMGVMYAKIFKQPINEYLPFIGISLVMWYFLAQSINDACRTFTASEAQIKQIYLPLSIYALQTLWRNIIIMSHNAIIAFFLMIYYHTFTINILLFPLCFIFICTLLFFLNIVLGIICTRYRDIPQIIQSVMQIMMFITPVFWKKAFIDEYWWLTAFNPLFHMLELLRAPLLNQPFPIHSLYAVIGMNIFTGLAAILLLSKYRRRLAFWV